MPWEETENEIRHRERDPGDFQEDSFRRIPLKRDKPRVFAIVGKLKGETSMTIQALCFPKEDGWTKEKAKAWYAEHYKRRKDLLDIPTLEYKTLRLDVKEADETQGIIEGIASLAEVEDLGGDIVEEGAFNKTLEEHPRVHLLWHHDPRVVLGKADLKQAGLALDLKAQFDMADPEAARIFGKVYRKLIDGLSIGYQTLAAIPEQIENRIRRRLKELRVWEVSVVTFPMLPQARVSATKEFDSDDYIENLTGTLDEIKIGRVLSRTNAARLRAVAEDILALLADADPDEESSEGKGAEISPVGPAHDHSMEQYRRYIEAVKETLKL